MVLLSFAAIEIKDEKDKKKCNHLEKFPKKIYLCWSWDMQFAGFVAPHILPTSFADLQGNINEHQ